MSGNKNKKGDDGFEFEEDDITLDTANSKNSTPKKNASSNDKDREFILKFDDDDVLLFDAGLQHGNGNGDDDELLYEGLYDLGEEDTDFQLANGASFSHLHDPRNIVEINVMADPRIEDLETGAAAISLDHSPEAKRRPPDPDTGRELYIPNEDAYNAKTILIDANTDPQTQLDKVASYIERKFSSREEGTTLATSLICDGMLYTAHMGDSPVLILSYDPSADPGRVFTVKQITTDHVASNETEANLLPDGIKVGQDHHGTWRVPLPGNQNSNKGLMVTRAIGDRRYSLNRTPDITITDLKAEAAGGKKLFVVNASDGLMERGSSPSRIEAMLNELAKANPKWLEEPPTARQLAYYLSNYRYSKSMHGIIEPKRHDDKTVLVQPVSEYMLRPQPHTGKKQATLINVADGHGYLFKGIKGKIAYDDDNNPIPAYAMQLSQHVVEEMQLYMQRPNLLSSSGPRIGG